MTRAAGGSIDKENFVIVQARNSNVPAGQQRKIKKERKMISDGIVAIGVKVQS
jgi:hypothetical protein